jgi:hypothetical protein
MEFVFLYLLVIHYCHRPIIKFIRHLLLLTADIYNAVVVIYNSLITELSMPFSSFLSLHICCLVIAYNWDFPKYLHP